MMNKTKQEKLITGGTLVIMFVVWTVLIQCVDVKPVGQNGTNIGFAAVNCWFHKLTGVNMTLYTITDWMGLIPLAVCVMFAGIGFAQLVRRRSLFKVDADLLILGIYYMGVLFCYGLFERIPVNFRPVRIQGLLEASYPSSTTLLVLAVMPTLTEQAGRRLKNGTINRIIRVFVVAFSAFMVLGRLISGVHWVTDIVGSLLFCAGFFRLYQAAVMMVHQKESR